VDKMVETQHRARDDGTGAPLGNPIDAYAPAIVAKRVEVSGVAKARLPLAQTITFAVLAGAFIAFGALFFLLAVTDGALAFGVRRIVGGVAFSLGLVLVIVAGAELFTGNNLIVMAWADKLISSRQLLRNWIWVYLGNLAGSLAMVCLAVWMCFAAHSVSSKVFAIVFPV